MLDRDLAAMYGVETKVLNQAVKRNIERFPEDFMFQLTKGECEILTNDILRSQFVTARSTEYNTDLNLRSQFVTAKDFTKSRTLPYAFTEQGVAMLSSVLRSPLAIQVNIGIIRAFVEFRHMASTLSLPSTNADVAQLRKDFEELKLVILTRVLVCNLMLLAQHYQNCNPKNLANVSAAPLVSLFLMRRRSDFLISFKCFFQRFDYF